MRHLVNIVNEAMLTKPATKDDNVLALALVSKEYIDDNLNLMSGKNKVCLVWSPEDCKGYMCANGGATWNDKKHWDTLKDLDKVVGKVDWKKVDDIGIDYPYRGQIGGSKEYDIEVYSSMIPVKDIMNVYKQSGVSLCVYRKNYATATLSQIFKYWRSEGLLS